MNQAMRKKYIASYQNEKDECWDLIIFAHNIRDAKKEARSHQKTYGKLYRVKLMK